MYIKDCRDRGLPSTVWQYSCVHLFYSPHSMKEYIFLSGITAAQLIPNNPVAAAVRQLDTMQSILRNLLNQIKTYICSTSSQLCQLEIERCVCCLACGFLRNVHFLH